MLGAIAGDVIGSVHEKAGTKSKVFPLFPPEARFTDDTVLTVAVADCLLTGRDYVSAFHDYYHAFPGAGYGGTFVKWASGRHTEPYGSWGNGSAMRVTPALATLLKKFSAVVLVKPMVKSCMIMPPNQVRGRLEVRTQSFLLAGNTPYL